MTVVEEIEPEVDTSEKLEQCPWHVKRNRTEMRRLGRRMSAGTGRVRRAAVTSLRAQVRAQWGAK